MLLLLLNIIIIIKYYYICVLMYAIKICGYTKVTGNPKSVNIKKCYWQIFYIKLHWNLQMGVRWRTMLIRGQSREVWIFSPIASCCTTFWKTICCPCLLASLAFLSPKLNANKQSKHWVVSEKIHTPRLIGIWKFSWEGGSKTLEILVGEGFF